MAQMKAQGSLTIIDTNDIERIYVVYAKHTNNTDPSGLPAAENWKETIAAAPGSGDYIWQRTVIKKTGTSELSYSDPVCVTGPEGDAAKNITAIETQYGISADWNTQPSSWSNDTPNYDSSKPNYWTRTRLKYEDNTYSSWVVNKDYALTKAIENSVLANSIAQSANENANGAMSQAAANIQSITRLWYATSTHTKPSVPSSEVTSGSASTYGSWSTVKPTATDTYRYFYYCDQSKTSGGVVSWSEVIEDTSYLSAYEINALDVRTKNFFKGKDSSYDGWFASGRASSEGLDEADATTYYYNARFGATHITLGYNKTPVIDLDGSSGAIKLYSLPIINSSTKLVTTAGKLGMQLTSSALSFYGSSTSTADVTLNSSGLNITNGSIVLGSTSGTAAGNVTLSNIDFTRSINSVSREQLRLAIGSNFGVKNDGTLYASNAEISGKITVGSGSDLSAGLSDYSTTSQMNSAIGTATNDMATKTYVGNQGYQNASQVNTIIEGKGYALNSDLTTEINQRKAQYGTSSTSASTRTKVVTCANFELIAGNEITVKFSIANTYISNSVQLNVNGKGAKDIWVANAVTSSTNQLLWGANAYITFKYDGTQFIVIGEPRTWYGASTTAAATAAKTDTTAVTGCVICKGAKIELAMSNNNTNTSATLNIQSTGAKNIYYGNTTTSPTVDNGHSWLGTSTATFTFDGQYYRIAGQTVISGDSITTGTISANRLNISDIISNGNIVVSNQISNFVTQEDIDDTIGATSVSNLSDGSDYTKTTNLGNTTAVQNAAKTASNYLGDTDSQAGVTLKAVNGTTTANTSTSNYIKINTNGLEVFKSGVSVALYGDTARIGKSNNSRFLLNADSLQAYNSSNTKYFEVSSNGMTYGSNTVASTSYADGKASAAQAAAQTAAQGYADIAEANASYSVEIQVTAIDYVNNSATLVAIPYYQGSTTMPTGVTLSYQWYKNGTALANTSTAPTIAGATTNTLQLGEGTDFGGSTTNAIYTCIIS